MSPTPRLPPDLQTRVKDTFTNVYFHAVSALGASDSSRSSADIARASGESILLSIRAAISCAQREHNERLSLQNRLPVEIWCHVWQYLPFADRIAVTHVCSRWRSTVLDFPALWKHLTFYTTLHASHCFCAGCFDKENEEYERHAPGWEDSRYPEHATNILDAEIILSRARGLPLHITLDIIPCRVRIGELAGLLLYLSTDHPAQLRTLVVRTADVSAVYGLLRECKALPSLESLSVEALPVKDDDEPSSYPQDNSFIPRYLSLPRLETLHVFARFELQGETLPSVRFLTFEPTHAVHAGLRMALAACPGTSHLTLRLGELLSEKENAFSRDADWWRERVGSLTAVNVTRVPPSCTRWIHAAFPVMLPELSLEYDVLAALPVDGGILRDLEDGIRLRITTRLAGADPVLVVRGTDSRGRVRQVSHKLPAAGEQSPENQLGHIVESGWFKDCWQRVIAVTTDAKLWPPLVSAFNPFTKDAIPLRTLSIVVDNLICEPPTLREGIEQQLPRLQLFPALRSLTLAPGTGLRSMPPKEIDIFVRGLRLTLPLDVLEIDHRLIRGGAATLKGSWILF
ncbi:hypothetical protein AURDEDRAFT_173589 [Auricularia subglabra TFB-10046 SS5]|uniref:F-box domain-containing protein n=1 Tax=Auricularia subglabra (strain TFB-10046 / SS5) TaxID=717982 RepID=J0WVQ5_AURST|nr:hypothetical protein AURDEDRAFT_173589 [Auricularia subglabra TFB-10046 SS5]